MCSSDLLKAQHSENEDHGIWSHYSWKIDGKEWKPCQTLFFGLQNHCIELVSRDDADMLFEILKVQSLLFERLLPTLGKTQNILGYAVMWG